MPGLGGVRRKGETPFRAMSSSSNVALQAQTSVMTNAVRAAIRLAWKGTKVCYLTLALIPTALTIAAVYHKAVGHPQQVVRAHLFFAWTGFLTLPLSVVILLSIPYIYLFDPYQRDILIQVQRTWAKLTVAPFFTPEIQGLENLDSLDKGEAVVYVSNHKSWADIYSLLCLPLPIRFLSKEEIFYIPVAGWSMQLIGHVGVTRSSKDSRSSVVSRCVERLAKGISIFIFAEGTRSRESDVLPFKRGAFTIAQESGAKIVPISISGTGKLMPPHHGETWLESSQSAPVLLKIHPPLDPATFNSVEELQNHARDVITSGIEAY